MARIGNEAKLILKLTQERMAKLKDSRIQTPVDDWRKGYDRCYSDWINILAEIVHEIEGK